MNQIENDEKVYQIENEEMVKNLKEQNQKKVSRFTRINYTSP